MTSNRTIDWHSPKLVLDNLLTVGETYTFYVWVKLAPGVSGTTQLTIKNTTATSNQYENLTIPISSSDQEWTLLSADYFYSDAHNLFVYVKGPTMTDGGGDYYIDDFSLVTQGAPQIDFSNIDDIVDIGAYESPGSSLSNGNISQSLSENIVYPNPALDKIRISKTSKNDIVTVSDLMGKQYRLPQSQQQQTRSIEVSNLSTGLYLLRIVNPTTNQMQTIRFIKN